EPGRARPIPRGGRDSGCGADGRLGGRPLQHHAHVCGAPALELFLVDVEVDHLERASPISTRTCSSAWATAEDSISLFSPTAGPLMPSYASVAIQLRAPHAICEVEFILIRLPAARAGYGRWHSSRQEIRTLVYVVALHYL